MTSLTPCRFYAQGTCRYGNSCRFYHEPRGQPGFFGNRTLAPATFQPPGGLNQGALNLTNRPQAQNQNLDALVEVVKKDMQEWQHAKIWPYSCYGPVGGKPGMPGFEDLSFEEFRLAFAQCGNNIPPEIVHRAQQIQQLRINYQQPTVENRAIIERLGTTPANAMATPVTSPFGGQAAQPQTGNIFGGANNQQQSTSIFGGGGMASQPTGGSIFGGSSFGGAPTFGQQQQLPSTNLFQNTTAPQTTAPSTGLFGAPQAQTQSLFGQAATPPQGQGLFQQPQAASVFQQQGAPNQTGGFFQQQNKPQTGIFQQAPGVQGTPQGNIFSSQQPQPPTGLFQVTPNQQPASGSIFGGGQQPQTTFTPPTGSIFGGNVATQQVAPTGGSIFGGGAQQGSPSIFGGSGAISTAPGFGQPGLTHLANLPQQKFVYSAEADLTQEEMQAFSAAEFSIDSLPLKVPPQSVCT